MTLRELRLWHYRNAAAMDTAIKLRSQRAVEVLGQHGPHSDKYRAEVSRVRQYQAMKRVHLSAVQALNGCFTDPEDTVERDMAIIRESKRR